MFTANVIIIIVITVVLSLVIGLGVIGDDFFYCAVNKLEG